MREVKKEALKVEVCLCLLFAAIVMFLATPKRGQGLDKVELQGIGGVLLCGGWNRDTKIFARARKKQDIVGMAVRIG